MATTTSGARVSKAEFGSDVIVDTLKGLGIDYVSMNPGASFMDT